MIKCNYAGLETLKNRLTNKTAEELLKICAQEIAEKLAEAAKGRTPVDTGKLVGGYIIEVSTSGEFVSAELKNNVEYASFVELGHRTLSHTGWVPGKFMLTLAALDIEAMAPGILEGKIIDFLEGCLSGGG